MSELIKVTGLYAVLAKGEVGPNTVFTGSSPLLDPAKTEAIVGVAKSVDGLPALVALVMANHSEDAQTYIKLQMFKRDAQRSATSQGGTLELVHFGSNGREHVEWIEP